MGSDLFPPSRASVADAAGTEARLGLGAFRAAHSAGPTNSFRLPKFAGVLAMRFRPTTSDDGSWSLSPESSPTKGHGGFVDPHRLFFRFSQEDMRARSHTGVS